jgi:hypothetical protein
MDPMCQAIAGVFWAVLGAGSALTIVTLQLFRTTRYLRAALAREQLRRIEEANETWRIASTAFAAGEPITLEDLLNKREADFRLKP